MGSPKHLALFGKGTRKGRSGHADPRGRLWSVELLEGREMLSVRTFMASDLGSPVALPVASTTTAAPLASPLAAPNVAPLAASPTGPSIQSTWTSQTLSTISVSQGTGEKPQSKTWEHDGQWFAVMPNSTGTWIWQLSGTTWTNVLKVSNRTGVEADVKPIGDLAHVLLFDGSSTHLASIEYGNGTYGMWSGRNANANILLPSSTETATIDVDSQGRMWVAYDNKSASTIEVRYSDGVYASWSSPVVVASGVKSDDICVITAMPNGQIGVLWSNQNTKRFGFRTHADGASPTSWSSIEAPAAQSAQNVGTGMADDHLNVAVGSDGTLYAAVKTSYDSSGYAKIALLVRRPNGSWDSMYTVSTSGTRGIVVLNEVERRLIVAYTSSENGGNILYRETPIDAISFSASKVLISSSLNNVSSTRQNFVNELVIMAGTGSTTQSVLLSKPITSGGGVNQAPTASAGPDLTVQLPGVASLNGAVADDGLPGLTALTSQWTVVSGPGSVSFANASAAVTTASFSASGTYVLQLTANDGDLSTSDTTTITVQSQPTSPTLLVNSGADQSITLPSATSLQGSVSLGGVSGLPSGATVQWSTASGPAGASFANPGALATTATFNQAGTYVLRLTVSTSQSIVSDDVTVSVAAAPTAAGPVGLWKFNEGSGTTAADSSGNNNLGTLQGGATFGSGHSGSGLVLNGSNPRAVVPDTASLDITGTITFSVWIAPSQKATQYVVKKAAYGSTDGYELSLSSTGKVFVRFNQKTSGDKYRIDSTSSYPTDGSTWMHVAATYDGTTMRLYINGQLQSSKTASFTIKTNNNALGIGAEGSGFRPVGGAIDDALVANRAFSAIEITALYQGTFAG